jgi:small-conductance mechanosensitive channel
MNEFIKKIYFGNTISDYIAALMIFVVCTLIISILRRIVTKALLNRSKKAGTQVDSIFVKLMQRLIVPFLYYGAFYYSIKSLILLPKISQFFDIISAVIVTFIVIRLIISTINYLLNAYFRKQEKGTEKHKQIKGITTIISILIWGLGIVFLLDNLGFKISAVVTGLGIGGVAVALAAQAVLKDFFSYFVIFFDRPFEIGDYITVGDNSGTIEQIGIKTTKLRALSGEQIVFANADLTDSRIHNFKRMQKRRIAFKICVIYQTSKQQLEEIPMVIKKIIEEQRNVTFDRGHFFSMGDSGLNFEFVYFVNSSDYLKYMDIQQAINLKIFDEFNKKGIEFAYPNQTMPVKRENNIASN